MHRDGDIRVIKRLHKHIGCGLPDCIILAQAAGYCHKIGRLYCDVRAVHFVQFIVMYIPCILYSLLSTPTNALHIFINNILYIASTATCFIA